MVCTAQMNARRPMPSSTSNYSSSATIKYNIYTSTRLKWKWLELHTLAVDRLTVTLSRERGRRTTDDDDCCANF